MRNPKGIYSLAQSRRGVESRDLRIQFQSKQKKGSESSAPKILLTAFLSGRESAIARATIDLAAEISRNDAAATRVSITRTIQTFDRKVEAEIEKATKEVSASLIHKTKSLLSTLFGIPSAQARLTAAANLEMAAICCLVSYGLSLSLVVNTIRQKAGVVAYLNAAALVSVPVYATTYLIGMILDAIKKNGRSSSL